MRQLVLLAMIFSSFAWAKGKKEEGRVDPVPGGARADYHFARQWDGMIKDQHFPILTKKNFEKGDPSQGTNAQPRFILHLQTEGLQYSNIVWDDGYWYYQYDNKEQGSFWLAVHPKYKRCFDKAKKKFEEMQWVVFPWGDISGTVQLMMEYPRQCLGDLKETGSKLPGAK